LRKKQNYRLLAILKDVGLAAERPIFLIPQTAGFAGQNQFQFKFSYFCCYAEKPNEYGVIK